MRALAVSAFSREDVLPDIAVVADFIPGFESSNWWGVGVPRNTPAGVTETLNKEINSALVDPEVRARLVDLGGRPLPGSPAEFQKLIAEETEKWAKVIKFAGIKPE